MTPDECVRCECRDDWSGFCEVHDALELVDLVPVNESEDDS